jgi:hypothetical protein
MTTSEIAPAVTIEEVVTAEPTPAKAVAIVPTPATWFVGLSVAAKNKIRFVAVEHLKLHPSCDFLPLSPHAYDIILKSVEQNGVLYPLAIAADGRVIDGRYRLRAAQELALKMLPVLTIDIKGDSVVDWIFHIKYDRQYQQRLSGEYKKVRATKMTTARLTKTKATAKRRSAKPEPKSDSRKEAARKFDVPTRKLNAVNILAKEKPDLYAKVATGEMKIEAALKQRGKNIEKSRITAALQLQVRPEDVSDDQMENRIHCGEAQDVLTKVADATASLVLFSPPYFGANVNYDPPLPEITYQQYLDQLKTVMEESFRISRSGGRMMIVVDTTHNPVPGGDEMLPIAADLITIARAIGWKFWNDFAWLKPEVSGSKTTFGSLASCSAPGFGRDHEWIILFFKDQKKLEGDLSLSDLNRPFEVRLDLRCDADVCGNSTGRIFLLYYFSPKTCSLLVRTACRSNSAICAYRGHGKMGAR